MLNLWLKMHVLAGYIFEDMTAVFSKCFATFFGPTLSSLPGLMPQLISIFHVLNHRWKMHKKAHYIPGMHVGGGKHNNIKWKQLQQSPLVAFYTVYR